MESSQFQQYLSTLEQARQADPRFASLSPSQYNEIVALSLTPQNIQESETSGWKDIEGAFKAQQDYEQQSAERALAQKQADYQDSLLSSGSKYLEDKNTLDENAASQGVLFSGGRVQREQALQKKYEQEQTSKFDTLGRNIGEIANDFNYKYGNEATKGLSQYFNQRKNSGSQLSKIYSAYNPLYTGTTLGSYSAKGRENSALRLKNIQNKYLGTSYNNQIN